MASNGKHSDSVFSIVTRLKACIFAYNIYRRDLWRARYFSPRAFFNVIFNGKRDQSSVCSSRDVAYAGDVCQYEIVAANEPNRQTCAYSINQRIATGSRHAGVINVALWHIL